MSEFHFRRVALVALFCLTTVACGGKQAELFEILDSGAQPLPVNEVQAEGERDGATTQARLTFLGPGSLELVLDLEIGYDPQPVLSGGSWTYQGPTGEGSGTVVAEAVTFSGGQGEGASVGGLYVLEDASGPRFRVDLPLTAIQTPGWTP